MNQEIYSVLKSIKVHTPKNPQATSDRQTALLIKSSELQVLLAEENEKSAKKIEKLTNVLIIFTIVIAFLTAVLVFFELRTRKEGYGVYNKKLKQK